MKKKIIIIGAGIAGLSAGCYGQMNGYETELFEMHSIPGGLCTSWNRKGYRIDGCLHWLMGANSESMFYDIWKELGVLERNEFLQHEYIMQIVNSESKKLIIYSDMNKLEEHMISLSPQDSEVIRELTGAVRRFKDIRSASKDMSLLKYYNITLGEFVHRFQSSFLKDALLAFAPKEYKLFSLIFQLAIYNNKDASWPMGGSLKFSTTLEQRYYELGGKIQYNSLVDEILVINNKVTGIKLVDGSIHNADYVISAADGYSSIFQMLKGQYVNEEIKALYDSKKVSQTSIQISLGVDCDLSKYPYCTNLILEEPITIGGMENTQLIVKHYCYDQTLCAAGKSVITSMIKSDYQYWENLHTNTTAYRAEKKKVADWFVQFFISKFPEAEGKIEVIDVSTPMTYYRYTHVWQGAYSGWLGPRQSIPNVLPGLSGFYMAGQWTQITGGVPTAAITGKGSIIRICKEDGKDFII